MADQMYKHMLDLKRGVPAGVILEYSAVAASAWTAPVAGMCGMLNSSGELIAGVTGWGMPLFLFESYTDPDISNSADSADMSGVTPSTLGGWNTVFPRGYFTCYVGRGPFEFSTTEYEVTAGSAPNTPLKSPATGGDAGKVKSFTGTAGDQTNNPPVVGRISKGLITDGFGRSVLQFWTDSIPGNGTP